MAKLSTMPPDRLAAVARRMADAGVAVTVLPLTDLFVMGRDQDHNIRRGVADANFLVEHGVNCSLSTNNVLNPVTPFGDCSLIRMANLHANVLQIGRAEQLRECFAMLTERSARLLNLKDYGLAVGNPGRHRHHRRRHPGAGDRRNPPAARRLQTRPPHGHPPPAGAASV